MAHQSDFTGPQIDDVIRICRGPNNTAQNLIYLNNLGDYINKITNHEQKLNDILGDDPSKIPPTIRESLNEKLSLSGGIMTGQIKSDTTCANEEAPSKALLRITKAPSTYAPVYACKTINGNISAGVHVGDSNTNKFSWYYHDGSNNQELAYITTLGQVFGAVWNDYAEYRKSQESEPGRVVCECGDGTLKRSSKRLQPGAEVISDTFGFAIGRTAECNTPIAVSGRVLAFPNEKLNKYKPGDPVCAGPNGTVSKMSRREVRKYPDRIIGTVSEIPTYEIWGEHDTKVNGRIWIRIR